jgi:LysR family carnitine catabolism transcriptional activator
MDQRRLRTFLAVVDHGTMTGAARSLYVSQPGVSQAIRELEQELGVALFDRVGRGVRLSAAGRALIGPARRMLRDEQLARDAVLAVAGGETGRLDLGCLPTLGPDPVAELMGAFRAAYPGVVVQLADPDDPSDLLELVRRGDIELAITVNPGNVVGFGGLAAVALREQRMQMILPPGAATPAEPLRGGALAGLAIVALARPSSTRQLLDEVFASAGVLAHIVVETSQRESILPLVLAGAGAALVPEHTARIAEQLGARIAPLAQPVSRAIVLVHRDAPLSGAAKRFLALAQATAI